MSGERKREEKSPVDLLAVLFKRVEGGDQKALAEIDELLLNLGSVKTTAIVSSYLELYQGQALMIISVPGQSLIGVLFYHSEQYEKAKPYIESAALQGDAVAENNLGRIYGKGLGVALD